MKARNTIVDLDHPTAGKVRVPWFPIKMEKTPATYRIPAPQLGEHTAQILEELGYSPEEIEELRKEGVVVINQ